MIIYILISVLIFLITFSVSLFALIKKKIITDHLNLIIPSICTSFWALYYLLQVNFILFSLDFDVFYKSGKQIWIDASRLYDVSGFRYLPSFAVLFAVFISPFPFTTASYIFFIINYISAILIIFEYDKILILMNVKKRTHRLMFLIIISNGYFVYCLFFWNQTKYLVFLIFLFIIRRELHLNKIEKEKNLNYYLINYGLFVFAIGMAPFFIFLLLIYIFHDINYNEIINRESIKKYSIVVLMFISQNFLFILYPSLILDFLEGINHPQRNRQAYFVFYLREWIRISSDNLKILTILFTIVLSIITIILIKNNKIKIEQKFSYFAVAYLFVGVFSYSDLLLLILFSFVLLLFVPHLNQDVKGIEFLKCNSALIMGLLSIVGIFFISHEFIIYESYPELKYGFFVIIDKLRWIFLLIIMIISLISIHLKKESS